MLVSKLFTGEIGTVIIVESSLAAARYGDVVD